MGTPAPTNQTYNLALNTGWNLIGDPFTASINWGAVKIQVPGQNTPLTETQAVQQGRAQIGPADAQRRLVCQLQLAGPVGRLLDPGHEARDAGDPAAGIDRHGQHNDAGFPAELGRTAVAVSGR